MKIFLIGPTYPYRGGIAHYTTLLYNRLRKRHDVTFVSYQRQYPVFLYPGKSDIDPSTIKKIDPSVKRMLDSINPFTWIQTAWMVIKRKPSLLILPWWVAFWTPQYLVILLIVKVFARLTPILLICHNVVEHESNLLKRICTKIVFSFVDYFIVHAVEEEKNLRFLVKDPVIARTYIPINEIFDQPITQTEQNKLKQMLGIENKKVILFFGFVRPYKGLRYLLEALPSVLKECEDIRLLVVGEFWTDKQEYFDLINRLKIKDYVVVVDRYVDSSEVANYFGIADFVISPYISATGSAIIQTAFGMGKSVVATNVGSLPELVEDGKTGYIVEKCNSAQLADAILKMYRAEMFRTFEENILKARDIFSWDSYVRCIEELVLN